MATKSPLQKSMSQITINYNVFIFTDGAYVKFVVFSLPQTIRNYTKLLVIPACSYVVKTGHCLVEKITVNSRSS